MLTTIFSEDFIKDKIKPESKKQGQEKLVIGAGSFGTVKFAISLVSDEQNKTSPAEVICIKKSKHVKFGDK